jgi:hypothetical protein
MLDAVSDYASISLVNARLFQALEARAQRLQQLVDEVDTGVRVSADWLAGVKKSLTGAHEEMTRLLESIEDRKRRALVRAVLADVNAMLQQVATLEDVVAPSAQASPGGETKK